MACKMEGDVLLGRKISLKVVCEKDNFSNCDFCKNVCGYELTYQENIQKQT